MPPRVAPPDFMLESNGFAPVAVTGAKPRVSLRFRRADRDSG